MKRRLLIIAICLLFGAVVNVAVAWGCAASIRRPYTWIDTTGFQVAVRRVWDKYSPREGPLPDSNHVVITGRGWSYMGIGGGRPGDQFLVAELKVGLPLRTLQCGMYRSYKDKQTITFNGWRRKRTTPPPLYLPYEPVWPGFAINTAFYATILWLLIRGPFVLRRFLRVRRGLCPKCAYPMGESAVCTECGGALARRA